MAWRFVARKCYYLAVRPSYLRHRLCCTYANYLFLTYLRDWGCCHIIVLIYASWHLCVNTRDSAMGVNLRSGRVRGFRATEVGVRVLVGFGGAVGLSIARNGGLDKCVPCYYSG